MIGRAGSTGIPGKNTYPVLRRPFAAHPLLAERTSRYVNRLYVSTNSPEIMAIAGQFDAERIERPPELVTSQALAEHVFAHGYREIVRRLAGEGKRVELVVLSFASAVTVTDGCFNPFVPFETLGDPKTLNCGRDSQCDMYFADGGSP